MTGVVHYRDGYKYQLLEPYTVAVPITLSSDIDTGYLHLSRAGELRIEKGYAWDGASGPTVDTPSAIRGSLIHDALYQLMREGCLGYEYRSLADDLLYQCLVEDGMLRIRAWYWWQGVRWGGGPSARPSGGRPARVAP